MRAGCPLRRVASRGDSRFLNSDCGHRPVKNEPRTSSWIQAGASNRRTSSVNGTSYGASEVVRTHIRSRAPSRWASQVQGAPLPTHRHREARVQHVSRQGLVSLVSARSADDSRDDRKPMARPRSSCRITRRPCSSVQRHEPAYREVLGPGFGGALRPEIADGANALDVTCLHAGETSRAFRAARGGVRRESVAPLLVAPRHRWRVGNTRTDGRPAKRCRRAASIVLSVALAVPASD